jgi:hypothetical protein
MSIPFLISFLMSLHSFMACLFIMYHCTHVETEAEARGRRVPARPHPPNAYSLIVRQIYTHMLDKTRGVPFVLTVLPLSCCRWPATFLWTRVKLKLGWWYYLHIVSALCLGDRRAMLKHFRSKISELAVIELESVYVKWWTVSVLLLVIMLLLCFVRCV